MVPTPRIELPLWGNIILLVAVIALMAWPFVQYWRARRK